MCRQNHWIYTGCRQPSGYPHVKVDAKIYPCDLAARNVAPNRHRGHFRQLYGIERLTVGECPFCEMMDVLEGFAGLFEAVQHPDPSAGSSSSFTSAPASHLPSAVDPSASSDAQAALLPRTADLAQATVALEAEHAMIDGDDEVMDLETDGEEMEWDEERMDDQNFERTFKEMSKQEMEEENTPAARAPPTAASVSSQPSAAVASSSTSNAPLPPSTNATQATAAKDDEWEMLDIIEDETDTDARGGEGTTAAGALPSSTNGQAEAPGFYERCKRKIGWSK